MFYHSTWGLCIVKPYLFNMLIPSLQFFVCLFVFFLAIPGRACVYSSLYAQSLLLVMGGGDWTPVGPVHPMHCKYCSGSTCCSLYWIKHSNVIRGCHVSSWALPFESHSWPWIFLLHCPGCCIFFFFLIVLLALRLSFYFKSCVNHY